MQADKCSSVLQAGIQKREKDINANDGRATVFAIPANHRQAERKLIGLIEQGILEIDAQGKVWRMKMWKGKKMGGRQLVRVKRRRAENRAGTGYLQVRAVVEEEGPRVQALAHRLVWQYFFGDIPDGLCINHRNGSKADNHPTNLEVVTYSENRKHGFCVGLINQDGERNPRASLTNEKARSIREIYAEGNLTQGQIAKQFEVSFQTVSRIIRGEVYLNVGGQIDKTDHRACFSERDSKTGRFLPKAS